MASDDKMCERCRYWHQAPDKFDEPMGDCTQQPPRVSDAFLLRYMKDTGAYLQTDIIQMATMFPVTLGHESCGQWTRKQTLDEALKERCGNDD